MADVIISVRGEHDTRVPAELGVVTVAVRIDGANREQVLSKAQSLAAQLNDELRAAEAAKHLATWSSDRLSVWSDRPWNQDGKQLPLVHHAVVTTRSEFTDFAALSEWVAQVSTREGVTIDNLTWQLTRETARTVESEVAQGAVQVAVERARAYAAALGLTTVTAVEIADTGLLHGNVEPEAFAMKTMMRGAADSAGSGAIELEPGKIRISSTVEARFAAS